jgi:hypothetical protein
VHCAQTFVKTKGAGVANVNDRTRDPLEEGEDNSNSARTSGSREESMKESGKDAFGRGSAIRNPDSSEQADAPEGRQDPADSGTTGLGRESPETGDRKSPGGVEGRE